MMRKSPSNDEEDQESRKFSSTMIQERDGPEIAVPHTMKARLRDAIKAASDTGIDDEGFPNSEGAALVEAPNLFFRNEELQIESGLNKCSEIFRASWFEETKEESNPAEDVQELESDPGHDVSDKIAEGLKEKIGSEDPANIKVQEPNRDWKSPSNEYQASKTKLEGSLRSRESDPGSWNALKNSQPEDAPRLNYLELLEQIHWVDESIKFLIGNSSRENASMAKIMKGTLRKHKEQLKRLSKNKRRLDRNREWVRIEKGLGQLQRDLTKMGVNIGTMEDNDSESLPARVVRFKSIHRIGSLCRKMKLVDDFVRNLKESGMRTRCHRSYLSILIERQGRMSTRLHGILKFGFSWSTDYDTTTDQIFLDGLGRLFEYEEATVCVGIGRYCSLSPDDETQVELLTELFHAEFEVPDDSQMVLLDRPEMVDYWLDRLRFLLRVIGWYIDNGILSGGDKVPLPDVVLQLIKREKAMDMRMKALVSYAFEWRSDYRFQVDMSFLNGVFELFTHEVKFIHNCLSDRFLSGVRSRMEEGVLGLDAYLEF